MSRLGFCAALGLAIATVNAAAQPADRTKFWKSVQKKCDETASTEISPLATAIAQAGSARPTAAPCHPRAGQPSSGNV